MSSLLRVALAMLYLSSEIPGDPGA
jgi:hypothetical protein